MSLARTLSIGAVIALLGAGFALSGCNTTAGMGKDISGGGQAVTNSAEKVKSGL
jgi:entericidin B